MERIYDGVLAKSSAQCGLVAIEKIVEKVDESFEPKTLKRTAPKVTPAKQVRFIVMEVNH